MTWCLRDSTECEEKKENTSVGTAIDWLSEIWSIFFIRLIINCYCLFWFVERIHNFTIGQTIISFCVCVSATRTFLSLQGITLPIRPSLHSVGGKLSSLIMTKSFSFKLFFAVFHLYLLCVSTKYSDFHILLNLCCKLSLLQRVRGEISFSLGESFGVSGGAFSRAPHKKLPWRQG